MDAIARWMGDNDFGNYELYLIDYDPAARTHNGYIVMNMEDTDITKVYWRGGSSGALHDGYEVEMIP